MNKNKLIFSIIWVVVVLSLFWLVSLLNSSWKNKTKDWNSADVIIWTYNLDKSKMDEIIKDFKSKVKAYEKKNITIENFTSYKDYKDALLSSVVLWKSPDIFMLNNLEKSFIENLVSWINPSIIDPNDFRKNYKTFIVDDLIRKWENEEWKKVDYVIWIPVWYETLGIYYNRKYVLKPSDLDSWAWVNNLIETIKERNPDVIPLWIMNWIDDNNPDVLTQFFMLSESNPTSFDKVSEVGIKEAFDSYLSYLNNENIDSSDNETQYYNVEDSGKTNLQLFSEWSEAMIIGYTSMINNLQESWFNNSLLYAAPFPHYFTWKWKTLVNYNYFVVNKNSSNSDIAYDFLAYLSTKDGAKVFLDKFTYLLPALVIYEQDKLQEKLHDSYNLVLGDFYKPENDSLLSSYDKIISDTYDEKITDILKDDYSYLDKIKKLQVYIVCNYNKLYSLDWLSKDCSK